MRHHWHNVYVRETVAEVVSALRAQGIGVNYNRSPEDAEDANGYIEKSEGVISSCVRWRRRKDIPSPAHDLPDAMACLQIPSSSENFTAVCAAVSARLTVLRACGCGDPESPYSE